MCAYEHCVCAREHVMCVYEHVVVHVQRIMCWTQFSPITWVLGMELRSLGLVARLAHIWIRKKTLNSFSVCVRAHVCSSACVYVPVTCETGDQTWAVRLLSFPLLAEPLH